MSVNREADVECIIRHKSSCSVGIGLVVAIMPFQHTGGSSPLLVLQFPQPNIHRLDMSKESCL